jgi:hypothetical protein
MYSMMLGFVFPSSNCPLVKGAFIIHCLFLPLPLKEAVSRALLCAVCSRE